MRKYLMSLLLGLFIAAALSPVALADAVAPDPGCSQMLVNRDHLLVSDYVPAGLVKLSDYMPAGSSVMMTREAAEAMGQMIAAMKADGISDIYGSSGYRSYDTQSWLYDRKVNYYLDLGYDRSSARTLAAQVVAIPGASEHQTGLALDFTTSDAGLTDSFANTAAGKWLAENSWRYGFILRYPKGMEHITGYIYEPWHFRYVGKVHAEYIYRNGITLDQYYEQLSRETVITYQSVSGEYYVIYLNDYNNTASLVGTVLSVSRAYADSQLGFNITAIRPEGDLFDIVGHWSENYIRQLAALQIVEGYTNNTFRPEKNISRAELITLISRVYDLLYPNGLDKDSREYIEEILSAEISPYGDVAPNAYYLEPLLKMEKAGILPDRLLTGAPDAQPRFLPDTAALRQDAALTIAPLFRDEDVAEGGGSFTDMAGRDQELQQAVDLLADAGVLTGNPSGTFAPDNDITRAEICAMLCRVLMYFRYI